MANDAERLMLAVEGGCPDCGKDLTLLSVGGVKSWFEQHFHVVTKDERMDWSQRVMADAMTVQEYAANWAAMKFVHGPGGHIWVMDQHGGELPSPLLWKDHPGMGEVGCWLLVCLNVHEHRQHMEVEVWQSSFDDYTMSTTFKDLDKVDWSVG